MTTFTGTTAPETIFGTATEDTIVGLGGSDYLIGLAGDDVLYGDRQTALDEIKVSITGRAFDGSVGLFPTFGLYVNGKLVGTQQVTASKTANEFQEFTFFTSQFSDSENNTVSIKLLNDKFSNTCGVIKDNNIYVQSVRVNGTALSNTGHPWLRRDGLVWGTGAYNMDWTAAPELAAGGKAGDDYIAGAAGSDTLYGGGGSDILNGGADTGSISVASNLISVTGGDLLTGGNGADFFQYAQGFGADTITDFENGIDKLQLTATAASYSLVDALNGVLVDFGGGQGVFVKNLTSADLMDDIALIAAA